LDHDLESFVGHVSHSSEVWLLVLESGDLREHNRSLFTRIRAPESNFLPFLISVGLTSDNPRSIRKLVSTGFDNHEGHGFLDVLLVLISPFLHLPLEGDMTLSVSVDVSDSDDSWLSTVRGQWAHDNNWVVESAVDLNSVPLVTVSLSSGMLTEPDRSSALDSLHDSEFLQCSQGEHHPLRFINSESPLVSLSIYTSAGSEDLKDVVALLKVSAEVHRFLTVLSGSNGLTVKHGDTSITKVTSGSEAPFSTSIDVREHDSVVVSDILGGSFSAELRVRNLGQIVDSSLTVSLVKVLLVVDRSLESVDLINTVTLPVHSLKVHSWLRQWESLDSLHSSPILFDLSVINQHLSRDETSSGGLSVVFILLQGKVSN